MQHDNDYLTMLQVLPRVMEQVVSCKDEIAQQYLFQAVIQASILCSTESGLFPPFCDSTSSPFFAPLPG
jgi:hypothetical protein